MGSREIRILNYEFSFCLFFFCRCGYSFVQLQWFCLSGRDCRGVFVRRSVTCGYEGYCLSGKSETVNWRLPLRRCFWLEKPNFHKELLVTNYGELSNREIMHYTLSIIHWFLGRCPKPHILFCLDAKKYAKKIKTASPHWPDSCLFAKRQITLHLTAAQTACLLPLTARSLHRSGAPMRRWGQENNG